MIRLKLPSVNNEKTPIGGKLEQRLSSDIQIHLSIIIADEYTQYTQVCMANKGGDLLVTIKGCDHIGEHKQPYQSPSALGRRT